MRQRGRVRWTQRAASDLVAIGEYIAADDPGAARRHVERLRRRAREAARAPLAGRHVPELRREDVREVLLGSYRIVYSRRGSTISSQQEEGIDDSFLEGGKADVAGIADGSAEAKGVLRFATLKQLDDSLSASSTSMSGSIWIGNG